ncbi:MAG: 50S ribosomal protein L17 [Erysipelotrichaceae bacterium]|nr:50S ribosomal protein L17 [Erysipelotrichaceae bacterium]
MGTTGRKNVRGKGGVRFKAGFDRSKNKNMLRNVVSQLIIGGQVKVTEKVAREIVPIADKLITLAKRGDLHARRQAARFVRPGFKADDGRTALQVLFDDLGPAYADRNGGYTRSLKLVNRRGDNAPMRLVQFVQ